MSSQLTAQPRPETGTAAARALRREGQVPAVIYGDGAESVGIAIERRLLVKQLQDPGFFTHIWEIAAGGETYRAIARDVQLDPVTDVPMHVDFMRVSATSRITVAIPVSFTNQEASPGLKRGALLNVVRHEVEMVCPPDNIPAELVADLTGFDIGDSVHYSNLQVPDGIEPVITDRDFTVATIATPSALRSQETAADDKAEGEEGATEEGGEE